MLARLPVHLWRAALDAVLPPRCLSCGAIADADAALCPQCWAKLAFLAPPCCQRCGLAFEFDLGPGAVCGPCAAAPPVYGRARAVLRYDDASKALLLALKHADRTEGVPAFGRWLARAGAELLEDAEVLVPVPLHWLRLFRRRYNQAALLALALARCSGVPVLPDALTRVRRTPSQGRMSPAQRRRNVAGAFKVAERRRARVDGLRVLLLDDVLTTGATAEACARALLASGAAAVDVLTLARVERPRSA